VAWLWAMSDRALPRSLRMMEGFGVHTFRLINAEGKSSFVRISLGNTLLGVHSVAGLTQGCFEDKDPIFTATTFGTRN